MTALSPELEWISKDLGKLALRPHRERLQRIALDRDVAVVFYQLELDALDREVQKLVRALRGSDRRDVIQLTRTRAMRLFEKVPGHPLARWAMTRAPEGHAKIWLFTARQCLLINVAPGGRLSLDPASPRDLG